MSASARSEEYSLQLSLLRDKETREHTDWDDKEQRATPSAVGKKGDNSNKAYRGDEDLDELDDEEGEEGKSEKKKKGAAKDDEELGSRTRKDNHVRSFFIHPSPPPRDAILE